MKILISFFLLMQATLLFASEGMHSGGGRGVVCFSDKETYQAVNDEMGLIRKEFFSSITEIQTLDIYYAKKRTGLEQAKPKLVKETFDSGIALYEHLTNRLKNTVPKLYEAIQTSRKTFERNEIVWEEQPIIPVMDTNSPSVIMRDLCLLTTMAIQFRAFEVDYLHIDRDLFYHSKHSQLSQASLLLHEFLYLHGRNRGHTSSLSVRKLLRLIVRDDKTIDYQAIERKARELNFID